MTMNNFKSFLTGALVSVTALLATTFSAGAFTKEEMTKVNKQVLSTVVQLTRRGNVFCTGNIIASDRDKKTGKVKTLILTAKHCVTSSETLKDRIDVSIPRLNDAYEIVGSSTYPAHHIVKYYNHDMALMELVDQDTFFDNVALIAKENTDMFPGRTVYMAGNGLGAAPVFTEGVLGVKEFLQYPEDNMTYRRHTASTAPGNSGGGVFIKDEDGNYRIALVTSLAVRGYADYAWSVPHDELYKFIDRVTSIELE